MRYNASFNNCVNTRSVVLRYTGCTCFQSLDDVGILKNYQGRLANKSSAFSGFLPSKFSFLVALLCLSPIIPDARAQDSEAPTIKLGETSVIPELRLDYVSLDNAFNSSDAPTDATGVLLSPSVKWQADRRLLNISAAYRGVFGSYSESVLDFNDHFLSFRVDAAPGVRHRASGEFSIIKRHELLGTGQTTFVRDNSEQVVSTTVRLKAGYTFGAASAKGNIGGGLIVGTETFNDVGTITAGDDNSEITPYALFSYRLSPDTRFVTQVNFRLTDYDEDRRDRTEIGVLAGLDLAATDRSGGSIRFGLSQANFTSAGVSDTTQVISDINLYFKPRTYSRFDLVFTRNFVTVDEDETGPGASLVNLAALSWRHEWTNRTSTLATLGLRQIDRNCPNNDSASNTAGLQFNVKIKRWLTIGAGVTSVSQTAELCDRSIAADEFDTDRTTMGIHLIGSL